MELKLNLNYTQILKLVYQLSDRDKKKLMQTLRTDFFSKRKKPNKNIQELVLGAPTWGDEQLTEYEERRDHVNKSRLI